MYRSDARVLIVGSLPGAESLRQGRYYGHPRNQFWLLVGGVIGIALTEMDYAERLQALIDHRIALWDVVATGYRQGSLDTNLRVAEQSDLAGLVAKLPRLRAVAANGALAAKHLPDVRAAIERLSLPSSSPANTMALATKQAEWDVLARYLVA